MTRARAILLVASLAGCADSGGAVRPGASPAPARPAARSEVPLPPPPARAAATPAGAPAAAPAGGVSARSKRLFDEALAADEEQMKLQIPTDWELLGRKWQAAADGGDLPEATFNWGVALERQGRRQEAAQAYRQALSQKPAFREAAANLALLSEPDEPRAAQAHWSDFLARFPDDALARARLAALAERAGQQDEAWRLAREALLREPRSSGALLVMMRVALARNQTDLAHLLALRAQKLDPRNPEIPTAIGRILMKQGDEAGAMAQWRAAVQLRGEWTPARAELLRAELAKQHWGGVAEQARALLQADPTDARAQLALGVAQRYLGEGDQAAGSYDAAERLSGGRLPEVFLARGVLLARVQEKCEPALAQLQRYTAAAGPAALGDGAVGKLERECRQQLAAARAAEEEARRMKEEAARKGGGAGKPTP